MDDVRARLNWGRVSERYGFQWGFIKTGDLLISSLCRPELFCYEHLSLAVFVGDDLNQAVAEP